MPRLLPELTTARCPICHKRMPIQEAQIGCYVQCPHCLGKFRLFESDCIKPKRLVLRRATPTSRNTKRVFIGFAIVFACGVLGVWAVWLFLFVGGKTPRYREETIQSYSSNEPRVAATTYGPVQVVPATVTGHVERAENLDVVPVATASATSAVVLSVRAVPLGGALMGEPGEPVPALPFTIYENCEGLLPYVPSGYMGDIENMEFDDCCTTRPHSGDSCIRFTYNGRFQWAGVAWQDPPNNWGDLAGGYDIRGARKLSFYARGKTGTERAQFKIGLIGRTKKFADTVRLTTGWVRLKKEWQEFVIPLEGSDLSRVITAFVVVVEGAPWPTTIYLDDIRFE